MPIITFMTFGLANVCADNCLIQGLKDQTCISPTWWLLRDGCTRSHSELGRETSQRRWYFVLRHGRVGRCQVCQIHVQFHEKSSYDGSILPLAKHLVGCGWRLFCLCACSNRERVHRVQHIDLLMQFTMWRNGWRGVEQPGSSSGS